MHAKCENPKPSVKKEKNPNLQKTVNMYLHLNNILTKLVT